MENTPRSITVDGISYDVAQFSANIQQAVAIYNSINLDLQKAQVEVVKNQSALQTIGAQISGAVKAELESKAKPKDEAPE